MGCGCKNNSQNVSENQEILNDKRTILNLKNFDQKAESFLNRKNKFSIIGVILFLLLSPVMLLIIVPIIFILLFNKLIFGRNTDMIKLVAFTKNKKRKK
jgi:hypothetical protein